MWLVTEYGVNRIITIIISDSQDGIGTGCWLDEVQSPVGSKDFCLLHSVESVVGPITADISPVVKRPEREAQNSPPSNVEVKNSILSYLFMAWCLIKKRGKFTLRILLLLVVVVVK
jgi:hypothetical protein